MRKLIIMATMIVVSLSSCSKNEVLPNDSEENAISFSTYTGISVKGTEMTNTTLKEGFGVLAYDHGTLGSFSTSSVPNFMYNTEVTGLDDTWSYSPLKYWSSDAYNYYSFFAYAPFNGDVISNASDEGEGTANTNGSIVLSSVSAGGAPTATFTIATDPTKMVDFVAGQNLDLLKSSCGGTVSLNMKHQLTRVTFSAKTSQNFGDSTYVNVTSIRLLSSAPKSTVEIVSVAETTEDDADNDTEEGKIEYVQIGDQWYKKTTIAAGTPYDDYFGSDALYSNAMYTFNSAITTDGDENVHTQDGQWSSVSELASDLSASTLLNTTDGFSASTDGNLNDKVKKNYLTAGVLVQSTKVELFKENEYLFLIPPVVTTMDSDGSSVYNTGIVEDSADEGTNLNNIQVEVIYDIVTIDHQLDKGYIASSTNSIAIVEIPEKTLVQGYAYDFLLTINGTSYTDPTAEVPEDGTPGTEDALDPVEITGNVTAWDVDSSNGDYNITVQEDTTVD